MALGCAFVSDTDKLDEPDDKVDVSDKEWRAKLSPEQYHVLRRKGTDAPFSGEYVHPGPDGMYHCSACGARLFSTSVQFDSGSGWPSFTEPATAEAVELHTDSSHGMVRTEVTCRRCGGHLGHVFDDGPGPSGQRWCINSTSLNLEKDKEEQEHEEN